MFRHCSSKRSRPGSASSWPSSLAARISPVDSSAHATASSYCFVECGSTSCSPKKNSTQRRCSVRDHVAVEQLPSGRVVEAPRPTSPRSRPSAVAACRGTARRARSRPARRPARVGRRRASTAHQLAWQWATSDCRPVSVASRTATMSADVRRPVWCSDGRRSPGAAVAAPVERDHPVPAGEVRDLRLPDPRVGDRRRRDQQQRRLAVAVHLVVDGTPSRSTKPSSRVALALMRHVCRRTPGPAG